MGGGRTVGGVSVAGFLPGCKEFSNHERKGEGGLPHLGPWWDNPFFVRDDSGAETLAVASDSRLRLLRQQRGRCSRSK